MEPVIRVQKNMGCNNFFACVFMCIFLAVDFLLCNAKYVYFSFKKINVLIKMLDKM